MSDTTQEINGFIIEGNWNEHVKLNLTLPQPTHNLLQQVTKRKGLLVDVNTVRQWVFDALQKETGIDLIKLLPIETKQPVSQP